MGKDLKVTVVGDTAVGKTSLLISYTTNAFPGDHVPTVFDNYTCNCYVDGEAITLGLWDTAGNSEYDELRPLSYPGTDAFIVCYSIIDPDSLESVSSKWLPEIKEHRDQECPIILVATKVDLREKADVVAKLAEKGKKPISKEDGDNVAASIEAHSYIECSALTQENLQEVFEGTVRACVNPQASGSATTSTADPKAKGKGKKEKKDKKSMLKGKKEKKAKGK